MKGSGSKWMVNSIPWCVNFRHWWYVDGTTFISWSQGQPRRMLNCRLRSITQHIIYWIIEPTLIGSLMVLLRLSYALIVITSSMMSALVCLAYLMKFRMHKLRVKPLSIMALLIEKLETMTTMQWEDMI